MLTVCAAVSPSRLTKADPERSHTHVSTYSLGRQLTNILLSEIQRQIVTYLARGRFTGSVASLAACGGGTPIATSVAILFVVFIDGHRARRSGRWHCQRLAGFALVPLLVAVLLFVAVAVVTPGGVSMAGAIVETAVADVVVFDFVLGDFQLEWGGRRN